MQGKVAVLVRRILIVEDEPLVALDLEAAVLAAGCAVAGMARTVDGAIALVDKGSCDAAILDANLMDQSAAPVAARLRSMGVPFVAVSGYTACQLDWLDDAKLISKPFSAADVIAEIKRLIG